MKNKKLLVLALIVIALLIVGITVKKKQKVSLVETVKLKKLISNVSNDKVTKIEFKAETKKLTIEKKDNEWTLPEVHNAKAEGDKVEALIKTLVNLEGELRSDSKEVLGDYGLTKGKALEIAIYTQGNTPVVLLAGKEAGYKTYFVRLDNSNDVYVINENLPDKVGLPANESAGEPDYKEFVNLALFADSSVDNTAVIKLLYKDAIKLTLLKEKAAANEPEVWKAENVPFKLKENGARELIRKLKELNADEIVSENNDAGQKLFGFDKAPQIAISYKTADNKEVQLYAVVNEKDKETYALTISGKSNIYTIKRSALNRMFFNNSAVFDLTLLKISESDMTEISVSGANSFTIKNDSTKNKWEVVSGENLKEQKIKNIVLNLATLSAYGFTTKKEPLNTIQYTVVIKLKDGSEKRLNISPRNQEMDNKYVAEISGVAVNILLQDNTVENLF